MFRLGAWGAVMSLCLWNSSFRIESPGLMAMLGNMSGPLSMYVNACLCVCGLGLENDDNIPVIATSLPNLLRHLCGPFPDFADP